MITQHSMARDPRATPPQSGHLPPIVVAFYERLRRLPLGVWADAAFTRTLPTDGTDPHSSSLAAARARLRKIVNNIPSVAAQNRYRVYDLVGVADGFLHPAVVARMKKVGLTAALALVVRDELGESDFELLYAPFAELIPVPDLVEMAIPAVARAD